MIRRLKRNAQGTFEYVRTVRRTPAEEREGLPRPQWWKAPLCWIRGHRYGHRGSVEITPWRLEFCPCCGEEVAGRTRWSQLEARPADDDLPWWDDLLEDQEDGS